MIFVVIYFSFADMLIPWHSRLLPRFSPTYISSLSLSASPPPATDHHEFSVPSFGGKLEVNSRIPVNVVPACPQTFPNMDRAFVKVIGLNIVQLN